MQHRPEAVVMPFGERTMEARLAALIAAGCLCLGADGSAAQTYPSRPIHIVVSSSPGGVTDLLGRSLAVRFGQAWDQQVVVENRPGANNQLGAEFVAKAAPDGHTLLVTPETTFVVNPTLYARLPYDAEKDFTPVAGLAFVQQALVTHPSLPVGNVAELIALAKAKPGSINYASAGIGAGSHLNMELFQLLAGVKLVAVHYRSATPALTDVIAGHVPMMFINIGSALEPWGRDASGCWRSAARAACRSFPICRPSRKAASRASKRDRGSACSRRAARRATSSRDSMARSSACSLTPTTAERCWCRTRCSPSPTRPVNMRR